MNEVLVNLQSKDSNGLTTARKNGRLEDYLRPHVDAFVSQLPPPDQRDEKMESSPVDDPALLSEALDAVLATQRNGVAAMHIMSGSALEVGSNVWARESCDGVWVRASIRRMEKSTKNKEPAMKFTLELQDADGNDTGDILNIVSVAVHTSLEEYEDVKLRNIIDDIYTTTVTDLITLPYLHEPAILSCLEQRFNNNIIYTNTGPILIALVRFLLYCILV